MYSVRGPLYHSLISTRTAETWHDRRDFIIDSENYAKRAGLLALHRLAQHFPAAVARSLDLTYTPQTWQCVGAGVDFTVYKTGKEVRKINESSVWWTADKQRSHTEAGRHQHRLMARELGGFAVPQEIFVAPHPTFPDLSAVQARQEFLPHKDSQLFLTNMEMTTSDMAGRLASFKDNHPIAASGLEEFVMRSRRLHRHHGLLPDTNGRGNIVALPSQQLGIIDGLPIGREQPAIQFIIQSHLTALDSALRVAT